MTDQDRKREMIRDLPAADLRGWWLAVFTWRVRPAFDGERAALMDRARALGLQIRE